ncbi:alpha/beta fold hydrolase [Azospirillum brasilense]|nr:alpha/beta fold hydrolase [Azospirillum brasilense]
MVTTRSPDRDDLRTAKGGARPPTRLEAAPGPHQDGEDGAVPNPPARSRATARRSPAYSFPYLPIRGELIDHLVHAWQSRFTLSVSPATLALAFADWAMHLSNAPGKQAEIADKAIRKLNRLLVYTAMSALDPDCPPCIEPLPGDQRFRDEGWQTFPFNLYAQSFLLMQQLVHKSTTDIPGVSRTNARIVPFVARQWLDGFAPSNHPMTNPEILRLAVTSQGMNFVRGAENWTQDVLRYLAGRPAPGAEQYQIGRDVAATPGQIIARNELMELIQYGPTTATVAAEPVLIVPAWIMKYYILDLSPENSLVRHLVNGGFTVFVISWRNPGPDLRDYGLDAYRRLGVMAALEAIGAVCGGKRVHACGYCLGGTLLAMAAAAMARDDDERLASVTLLAAQTDFTEAGELMLFINESQIAYLEDTMWECGYLDTPQMAGAFQMLRSNDLIWSRLVRQYLRGDEPVTTDLMAWNADGTRLPYRMHSEYMRRLLLSNDLAEGRFHVEGRPIALTDIRAPIFAVGTVRDHVAPWKSVYKIHLLSDTAVTFVLAEHGHNTGIIAPPGSPDSHFRITEREADARYIDPDTWSATAPPRSGSWWPAWTDWLMRRSSSKRPAPPTFGEPERGYPPLGPGPGRYVLEP